MNLEEKEHIKQTRGKYSPPTGNYPIPLPDYWNDNGTPITDLYLLSDEELSSLGWKGPIEDLNYDPYTQDKIWNKNNREWEIKEISEYDKKNRIDYILFWNKLIKTKAYDKIKNLSKQSLEVNTIATEFISLLTDAKIGNTNIEKIQEGLTDIIENIEFTEEELSEIQEAFVASGMHSIYTLT